MSLSRLGFSELETVRQSSELPAARSVSARRLARTFLGGLVAAYQGAGTPETILSWSTAGVVCGAGRAWGRVLPHPRFSRSRREPTRL